MKDLIYRQDAIKLFSERKNELGGIQGDLGGAMSGAVKLIESLPSTEQWISVTDRVPKIEEHHMSKPCLCYCSNGVYCFGELEENIFGQVGWNCAREDDYHEPVGEVIAWMPLPEPYRGDADE